MTISERRLSTPGPEIIESFSLRMPMNLRKRVHKSAIANRRSMNAEMLVLMEKALDSAAATGATPGSTTPVAVES